MESQFRSQYDMDKARMEYFRYLRGLKEWPAGVKTERQRAEHIGVSVASLAHWRKRDNWEKADVSFDDYLVERRDGSSGYTRRSNLPVGYKSCPKCDGTGEVLCHGKEIYQYRSLMWAGSWHGKAVLVPWLESAPREKTRWGQMPGWAQAVVAPGGWGALKVFVSVDKELPWGQRYLYKYAEYEMFEGHRLYYHRISWSQRDLVKSYDLPMPDLNIVVPFFGQNIETERAHPFLLASGNKTLNQ